MLGTAGWLLVSTLTVVTCSSNVYALRYMLGDAVYNGTASCYSDDGINTTNTCCCPEESPTFVQESNSCVQDATLLDECDLQLDVNISSSVETIPFVFVPSNTTKELHILPNSGFTVTSDQKAIIRFKNDSMALQCDSIRNISLISGQNVSPSLQLTDFRIENNSIQILTQERYSNALYRLDLNCNCNITEARKCLLFKLVDSQQESIDKYTFRDCLVPPTTTEMTSSAPSSTTPVMPTDEPSIWLRYNRLLIYVVIGGGCVVGLILVFIIMLCILAGCIARRRRYRARRKQQLERGTQYHISRMQGRPSAQTRRNLSHSITNLPEIENHSPEDTEPQEPQPPTLVKAEVPTIPRRPVEEDDQVTFGTFKRRPKGQKPDEQQSSIEKQPTRPKELPPKAATMPNIPVLIQPPKPPLQQMSLTDTPTQAYYETVVPVIKSTQADEQTDSEAYDILDHQRAALKGRHFTSPNYSQLSISRSKSPTLIDTGHSYSLITPRTRTPSTPPPVPPPLSPSYNGLELLRPQNRFSKDILTSSWSKPSHTDKVTSHITKQPVISQEDDLYDYPTKKKAAPKPQRARKRGAVKVTHDGSEVIYDVPPGRKISDDNTSIDSYVDMTQYTITKL